MKFDATAQFKKDYLTLPIEHRRMFHDVIPAFNKACEDFIAAKGNYRWPRKLRVTTMVGYSAVWEMTWSFASPDGRATFEFAEDSGEIVVRWRRIGNHKIYSSP